MQDDYHDVRAPRTPRNRYPSVVSSSHSTSCLTASTLATTCGSSPRLSCSVFARASEMPLYSPSVTSSLAELGFSPSERTESSNTSSRTLWPSDPPAYEVGGVDAKMDFSSRQHCQAMIDEHRRTRPDDAAEKQEPMATFKGLHIYELPPLRFSSSTAKIADKRLQMKRYIAHFQLHATMDEITWLLRPNDHDDQSMVSNRVSDGSCTQHVMRIISPQIAQVASLWRPSPAMAASASRSASCGPQSWTGIQWVVQKMPSMFARDRDYVLLEHHHTFTTKTSKRGYVQLLHSTDAPHFDPGVAHGSKRLTRGTMYQSGVVVLESESTPGLLHVSVAMEVDFFGTYSPLQHRHVVIKRLSKWSELRGLVWKKRMAESGKLVLVSSLRKSSGPSVTNVPTGLDCQICPTRPDFHRAKVIGPSIGYCHCCRQRTCIECMRHTDIPAFLVDIAIVSVLVRQQPSSTIAISALSEAALKHARGKQEGAVAMLCAACIDKYDRVPIEPTRS